MSSETQYYCDICDKEVPKRDIRVLAIKMITSINYEELDICDKCYDESTKHLFDNAESWEKKKLGSIFKMWVRRKKEMKAIDKAKEIFSNLSKTDIIENACPDTLTLKILEAPSHCTRGIYVDLKDCENCWNRELEKS